MFFPYQVIPPPLKNTLLPYYFYRNSPKEKRCPIRNPMVYATGVEALRSSDKILEVMHVLYIYIYHFITTINNGEIYKNILV